MHKYSHIDTFPSFSSHNGYAVVNICKRSHGIIGSHRERPGTICGGRSTTTESLIRSAKRWLAEPHSIDHRGVLVAAPEGKIETIRQWVADVERVESA